jgi:hypothetical protein
VSHAPLSSPPGRAGGPDWLFWAFVAVAGCAFAYHGLARERVRVAASEASVCLAQRDPVCAASAIERGRTYASKDEPRLDVAAAGLQVLNGKSSEAARAADVVRAHPELEPKARGELLLVDGDIAAARGQSKLAREHWLAARDLVEDPSLVSLRTSRADHEAVEQAQDLAGKLTAVSTAFDELFELATTAPADRVSVRAGDVRDQVRALPDGEARTKLFRALEVATRAASNAAMKRASVAYDPYSGSTPPAPPADPSPETLRYDPHARDRGLARYQEELRAYEARKTASDGRRAQGEADAINAARVMLEEAKRLVGEGLAMMAPTATDEGSASGASGAP